MDTSVLGKRLHKAVSQNQVAEVHALLKQGVNPNSFHECWTVLHLAVCAGYDDIVQLLIDYGTNINAQTTDIKMHDFTLYTGSGATPLHVAVDHSTPDVVRILLLAGANPNLRNQYRALPLDVASQRYVSCLEKCAASSKLFNKSLARLQIANQLNTAGMLLSAGAVLSDVVDFPEQAFVQQKFQVYLVYFEQWDILNKIWSSGHKFYIDPDKGINPMYLENVGIDQSTLTCINDALANYNNCRLPLFKMAVNRIRQSLKNNIWCGLEKLTETTELPNCVLREIMLINNNG